MSDYEHNEEIEIEVEVPTDQSAPTGEPNTEDLELEDDESKKSGSQGNQEIDYAKELEIAQGKLSKAEDKIVKLKKDKKQPNDEDLTELEERLARRQDEKLAEIRAEALGNSRRAAVSAVASSEAEAKLIEHHLDNSIKPTGNIVEDVKRAKILANEKKIVNTVTELQQTLVSKHTAGGPSFSGQKPIVKKKIKATPEDIRIANQMFGGDVARYLKYKNK